MLSAPLFIFDDCERKSSMKPSKFSEMQAISFFLENRKAANIYSLHTECESEYDYDHHHT